MVTVRRWYIYLVCAVSLQSVTWAVIALGRNLLIQTRTPDVAFIAFQIAVIVIGLPLYLAHWLWVARLVRQTADERESALRRFYLYGTLASCLGPFAVNAFHLLTTLLWQVFGRQGRTLLGREFGEVLINTLTAMVVLTLSWAYHQRLTTQDAKHAPETGNAATVRRLYVFGFSAVGVTMTTLAVIHLLRWLMYQFGERTGIQGSDLGRFTDEVTRLVVGASLWLFFWRWAQNLFAGSNEEEHESALRKFYLYAIVFISALGTVANATGILAGVFRRLLALPPRGDIRGPLPIIIGLGVLWAYHAFVLRADAARAAEAPRQASIRRLYLYLVAAVGLGAFVTGLGGDLQALIYSVAEKFISDNLREQLAWYTSALIAGLPVWLLPWRSAQIGAVAPGPAGADERRSVVRKIYLYFFLFVATMTVLGSAVYIVYRLLSLALGADLDGNLLTDLAQAIAYGLMAVGVWLYHGAALRGDGRANQRDRTGRVVNLQVAVMDVGEGRFGQAVLEGLRRELPDLTLTPIGLTPSAAGAMGMTAEAPPSASQLAEVDLIVGPWMIAAADGGVPLEIVSAVAASPARKLLAPVQIGTWEWAGVDRWNMDALANQTVRAVRQIVEGEEVRAVRPMSAGGVVGAILLVLLGLRILVALISGLSGLFF
jgi:hypothetical protein